MHRLRQSVCRWCYPDLTLDELATWCLELGLEGIDLLTPEEALVIQKHGLICPVTAAPRHSSGIGAIPKAFNHPAHHQQLWEIYRELIPAASEAGIKNVIVFSGNRNGLSDQEGLLHCARGLHPLLALAEKHDVILAMELLNSKIDHPDYQCDNTSWALELCQQLKSPHFRLIYDIYHMQVMEGDIIATIKRAAPYISHFHTAGCPGRHQLDDAQELNYLAISQAIAETGFDGFIGHEFIPYRIDGKSALRQAIQTFRPVNNLVN